MLRQSALVAGQSALVAGQSALVARRAVLLGWTSRSVVWRSALIGRRVLALVGGLLLVPGEWLRIGGASARVSGASAFRARESAALLRPARAVRAETGRVVSEGGLIFAEAGLGLGEERRVGEESGVMRAGSEAMGGAMGSFLHESGRRVGKAQPKATGRPAEVNIPERNGGMRRAGAGNVTQNLGAGRAHAPGGRGGARESPARGLARRVAGGQSGGTMSMNWPQLLCADRLGKAKAGVFDAARSEFRRDSDRITFTTAFRRLQDKTQVFPLADNDYVRTRLTHSLEVASVGRSLGARVGAALLERHGLEGMHGSDFGEIVSAAALAHDLGNPPFGHSGEDAIRHWFKTSEDAQRASEGFTAAQRADIERYEGNAQGFRLLTQLQMPDNEGGLQLTHATLGAFTKYPRESVLPSVVAGGEAAPENVVTALARRGASAKKFGFYQSERAHFASVAEHCGLLRRAPAAAWWARHPLAFLVEAADDICYRLVDFEDGFRAGHLRYKEVRDAFRALMPEANYPARSLKRAHTDMRRVQILRATTIGAAIEDATAVFLEKESGLLEGTFDQPLIEVGASARAWAKIQKRSSDTIYRTPRGVEIEAAGFEVLGGLLDVFVSALNDVALDRKAASPRSQKLLLLVPAESLGRKGRPDRDPYLRLLKMLDFVSGMTDSYAVALYKKVRGISLPGW